MAHAEKESESLKKHGDPLEGAVENRETHNQNGDGRGANVDRIPAPENGSHEKSHAAHLGGSVHEHTKRQGPHPGASPGELREPPQEISRSGKQHRKQ